MKITRSDLRVERQWKSATGLDEIRFNKLLPEFEKCYLEMYGTTLASRLVDNGTKYCINNEEELLLFTLFSLKVGLGYDVLGIVCGMDGSNAKRDQEVGLEVLGSTLAKTGDMPRRKFLDSKDFESYFAGSESLIIDATEQRIQRPSDKEEQNSCYSGKKKAHTLKAMIIRDAEKRIGYISHYRVGKVHDYNFLKKEFNPEMHWFSNFTIHVDLGFLGIAKDYIYKHLNIPHKKKPKQELTELEKSENKALASQRIGVEHSIGGLKRYRILSDRLRIHDFDLYDVILGVCAGLWNFHVRLTA